jgi:hypothetical protein
METIRDHPDFDTLYHYAMYELLQSGREVNTGHWQALKNVPQVETFETQNVVVEYQIPATWQDLHDDVKPSTPWAELQFQERVGGDPLNPGDTFHLWPWYAGNVEKHKEQGEFSHTYMERMWPRFADDAFSKPLGKLESRTGIRYRYGDLDDVVNLLWREPTTRQAYLPIWFPEDTGAHHGERVPCSLGYHFMRRDSQLHVNYVIRSCDLFRHFVDDVYLAARLGQWVLKQLKDREPFEREPGMTQWQSVVPGTLTMWMMSLHIFKPELSRLERLVKEGTRA